MIRINRSALRLAAVAAAALALSGCNAFQRLSEVGEAPKLSRISNPVADPNYQPVALPMPAPVIPERHANSLWRPGARAFFRDQRASQVGDILTVMIEIQDEAKLSNSTSRNRNGSESVGIPVVAGFERSIQRVLPHNANPDNLADINSTSRTTGEGELEREETIKLKVAALITQVLPNGNLVIRGNQEVRVNHELRELQVSGVIRSMDITSQNTVSYDKIAEARIAYGGRGALSDVQQPRYGQQILDILMPF